ncbi:hypothetical protein LAC03_20580 [Levilactobacillus acidifarinae]|nr:hypothetical protein LAC03_20580 [Levilactobacillus acidifarinae]
MVVDVSVVEVDPLVPSVDVLVVEPLAVVVLVFVASVVLVEVDVVCEVAGIVPDSCVAATSLESTC